MLNEEEQVSVKVCCRVRPLQEREKSQKTDLCVDVGKDVGKSKIVHKSATGKPPDNQTLFQFDRVFPLDTSQREVYEYAALPIVKSVLSGFNATVFAYGQTSSGKTFTMEGPDIEDPELQGVIPRMIWTVFDGIYQAPEHVEFLVKISMVELYRESIKDLLCPEKDNLKIKEDKQRGIYIHDVTESYIQSEQEIFDAMKTGHYNRTWAATNMNEHSSRSHLVFILIIEQKDTVQKTVKRGKLHLVDLAGSEKVGKTGASGDRLDEAKMINKSLSALGNVINALTDTQGRTHVPYRDSKLTRLLQESLGGNSKTSLIITVSPSALNEAETLSTLRFGQRAKMIKNAVRVNQELTVEQLKAMLEKARAQLRNMKARCGQLEEHIKSNGLSVPKPTMSLNLDSSVMGDDTDASTNASTLGDSVFTPSRQMTNANDDLRNEVADIREENNDLKQQLHLLERDAKDNTQKLLELQKEKDEKDYERDEQNALVQKIEIELQTKVADHEAVLLEKKSLKNEIEELQRKIAERDVKGLHAFAARLASLDVEEVIKGSAKEITAVSGEESGAGADEKLIIKKIREMAEASVKRDRENDLLKQQIEMLRKGESSGQKHEAENLSAIAKQKDDQILKLEMELTQERENVLDLEEKLRDGDRPLKRKVSQLDKNLEALTVMYHRLVSQNSGLKVEVQVNEKKVIRKDQRIVNLEKSLKEAKNKYEKLLTQCANLTAAMDLMGRAKNPGKLLTPQTSSNASYRPGNLVRPLKGKASATGQHDDSDDEDKKGTA